MKQQAVQRGYPVRSFSDQDVRDCEKTCSKKHENTGARTTLCNHMPSRKHQLPRDIIVLHRFSAWTPTCPPAKSDRCGTQWRLRYGSIRNAHRYIFCDATPPTHDGAKKLNFQHAVLTSSTLLNLFTKFIFLNIKCCKQDMHIEQKRIKHCKWDIARVS